MNFNQTDPEEHKNMGEAEAPVPPADSFEDSGHVAANPGYGWENSNRHLVGEPPVPEIKVPVKPISESVRAELESPRKNIAVNSGPGWAFWWLLFILLILGLGVVAAFQIWDTRLIRDETMQSETVLHDRIQSTDAQGQNRLQERSQSLEVRLDQIWLKLNELTAENAALKARIDSTAMQCQASCQPPIEK